VTPVNDPPVAVPSTGVTAEDTPVTLTPVVSDVDGDPLTITSATSPNGTVVINPDGTLTFTPVADYHGPAVITYVVSDGHGGTATSTITVAVTPVNDAPVAVPSTGTTVEDTPVTLTPVVSDADGDPLTITTATSPNGTVVINPDGTLTFTPVAGYNGPAVITYTVSDGHGGTATATITVDVAPASVAPVVDDIEHTIPHVDEVLTVEGMVNDAAEGANPLNSIYTQNDVRGLINAVANSFGRLNGTGGIESDGEITRTVAQIDREVTGLGAIADVVPFLGGSIANPVGASGYQTTFGIDTTINEGLLYLQLIDQSHGKIVNYRITRADGRALPDWIRIVQGRALIAEQQGNEKIVDIKIQAILADGKIIEDVIKIDLDSGSIMHIAVKDKPVDPAELFSDQLMQEEELKLDEETALVEALASLRASMK
jgi:hypothetical protein